MRRQTSQNSYDTLTQPIQSGGLKLIDFEIKIKSLHAAWVKRVASDTRSKWKAAAAFFLKTDNFKFMFQCYRKQNDEISLSFYADISTTWCELNAIRTPNAQIIKNQVLWNNQYITIDNKPFVWQNWLSHGIMYINDLIDECGNFLDHDHMSQKYNINCNFLNLIKIRHSIPLTWRQTLSSCQNYYRAIVDDIHICVSTKVVSLLSCTTKDSYSELLYRRPRTPKCLEKWRTIYDGLSDEILENYFRLPFYTVRDTKIQSFQYKIIPRIINCNKKLYEIKIKPSPLCDHCGSVDDIPHVFVLCPIVLLFWKYFYGWWNSFNHIHGQSFDLTGTKEILFGIQPLSNQALGLNFCVLYAKYFIYKQRLFHDNNYPMKDFLAGLRYTVTIEKDICENKTKSFQRLQNLLDLL